VSASVSLPKVEKKQIENEHMRQAILHLLDGKTMKYVVDNLKVTKATLSRGFERNVGKGLSLWKQELRCMSKTEQKSVVKQMKENIMSKHTLIGRAGNPTFKSYLTEKQEAWLASLCEQAAGLNIPLDAIEVEVYAKMLAVKNGHEIESVHKDWKRKFFKRHNLKQYSVCSIDKARCQRVSEESRTRQFERLASLIQNLVAKGEMPEEALTDSSVLAQHMWNMDETGAGDGKGNRKKIFSKKQYKQLFYFSQANDGDHAPFHVSVCMLTRATGELGDFFVIHAEPTKKGIRQNHKLALGLPPTFSQISTNSGSMTKQSFPTFCDFFVKRLPKGYGKDGKATILLLDQVRLLSDYFK
jgi:hypothetical protein